MNTQWSKADLHIHTNYSSDGTASVVDVLEHVVKHTDLRVIAITDHDTIDGALEARRIARAYGIDVIVGEEISTADGHMLALFIEQMVPPGQPASTSIAAVHAQGGLCIPAHPYAGAFRRWVMRDCASAVPVLTVSGRLMLSKSLMPVYGSPRTIVWQQRQPET